MGKPASSQPSRRSSVTSLNTKMSKERLTTPAIMKKEGKRRNRLKTHKSIQKLFNRLRESIHDITGNSIIDLDDSAQTTVSQGSSHKNLNVQENVIVIADDSINNITPKKHISLHHSTPISNKKAKLDSLILAQSNNNISAQNLNETREINKDSFLTIDLTTESGFSRSSNNTVIDVDNTNNTVIDIDHINESDCVEVSTSMASMSGDSDVTVLQNRPSRKLRKFTKGIAKLNASEKGKLLEMITQTIFNGCNMPVAQSSAMNIQKSLPRAPDTPEDAYIKEVILGGKASRNSVGSNIYHPTRNKVKKTGLRMIVIDGSNVAMEHSHGQRFSVRGLQICIDYFLRRGHVVKAFVPRFRCKAGMSTDGRLLDYLERQGLVIYTPSRQVQGKTITPYDDRYILQCAAEFDGIVVSGDNYRDLMLENPKWRFVIENRLLPFTWVDDMIMFPRDPLGRNGPTLENFLKHSAFDPMMASGPIKGPIFL